MDGSGARDPRTLAELVERRELDTQVSSQGSWREPADAIEALVRRRISGKAVLHIN